MSPHDVSAGYDIRSFEKNERLRFIEVKSSVGGRVAFEWSVGERKKAQSDADRYFVYFVPFSYSLPALSAPIVVIHDPHAHIARGWLEESAAKYAVIESPNFEERKGAKTDKLQ